MSDRRFEIGDEVVALEPLGPTRQDGNQRIQPGAKGTLYNVIYGDPYWDKRRTDKQLDLFYEWLTARRSKNVVVIECGAGIEIPSIRERSEEVIEEVGGSLVRINPSHFGVPTGQVGLELGALEALEGIQQVLKR